MKIFIEKENKHLVLDKVRNGKELLATLKINPATVLLVKNDEVVLIDEELQESDEVRILSVVSGG